MSARPGQSGTVYRFRGNWIGQWLEDVNGQEQRIRKSVTLGPVKTLTKSEARRMLQEHLSKLGINTQEHLERSLSLVLTFKQAADKYEAGRLQDLKPSTRRNNAYHLRKYLRPHFGGMSLDDITPDVVNEAVRTWAKKSLSRNTLRNIVNTLRSVTGKNFGKSIKYPSQVRVESNAEEPCFTPEQMAAIVELARQPHYVGERDGRYIEGYVAGASPKMKAQADDVGRQMSAFFATAAGTGMRSGELCGLRIEDVNLRNGIISVRRSSWEGDEQNSQNAKLRPQSRHRRRGASRFKRANRPAKNGVRVSRA